MVDAPLNEHLQVIISVSFIKFDIEYLQNTLDCL